MRSLVGGHSLSPPDRETARPDWETGVRQMAETENDVYLLSLTFVYALEINRKAGRICA